VDANVRIAHIIGDDEHDVGRSTLRFNRGLTKAEEADDDDGDRCKTPANSFHIYSCEVMEIISSSMGPPMPALKSCHHRISD
jgi:hypothetical protein